MTTRMTFLLRSVVISEWIDRSPSLWQGTEAPRSALQRGRAGARRMRARVPPQVTRDRDPGDCRQRNGSERDEHRRPEARASAPKCPRHELSGAGRAECPTHATAHRL